MALEDEKLLWNKGWWPCEPWWACEAVKEEPKRSEELEFELETEFEETFVDEELDAREEDEFILVMLLVTLELLLFELDPFGCMIWAAMLGKGDVE